ncbi:MAG: hypothetical protein ACR2KB_06230, partial [Chitinophagaceae bacterium]
VTIAFLCSSIALFSIGGFLLLDSCLNLIDGVHPTIGSVVFFGAAGAIRLYTVLTISSIRIVAGQASMMK